MISKNLWVKIASNWLISIVPPCDVFASYCRTEDFMLLNAVLKYLYVCTNRRAKGNRKSCLNFVSEYWVLTSWEQFCQIPVICDVLWSLSVKLTFKFFLPLDDFNGFGKTQLLPWCNAVAIICISKVTFVPSQNVPLLKSVISISRFLVKKPADVVVSPKRAGFSPVLWNCSNSDICVQYFTQQKFCVR